ncbi:MAG: hypothetical protein A3I24_02645 [Candidatus Harrisonbacteria bacterium RIFCSPLOWO2_02_FULL_41_13b]|uniref:O-antigen ligase-related domain-containing protein n=1 Tax=Candidatus Harrisonbacteria bacterium RIFCSPLOWO2_02_FULL_41_13b TaxID=1798409 RepID=A0A1G1ZSG8_9BACT|nr:MAG: hypothetical protein A3J53_00405 [Candidatus Harrisonbacteria bacterium RIFCSPHIGHO2_02_FULL_40_20]OGY67056.1 MAG: hypothetical protein A3I24_02645 [Candidatus Harrisonbacteria bacterium RIFCSPLOWO2_02_FULL_41_13b]
MNLSTYQLKNYYLWAIKALIFVIPFLSLWIATSMYFPYITGRNFVFRILVELAIVLWVGLVMIDKSYRPKPSSIFTAVFIFILIVGLADMLGVNPIKSFWSNYERMEGYLTFLHLGAYFLILTTVFKRKDWLVFFNIFAIASILVGFWGVLQKLGLKEAIQGGGVRIDGTIGNPTYLAAYLLLATTLFFILFFNAQKRWQKYLYLAGIVFNLIIIYFSATRGVVLALLVAFFLFLILYLAIFRGSEAEKQYRKWALILLALIVILPSIFWLIKDQSWVQENEVLSRFADISLTEKTTRSRFLMWNLSWQAVKERPILGWGQENYIQVFSKYYDPRLYDQEPWFDRAHNIIFDWLINAGALGLAAYLSIFGALFVTIARVLKRSLISKKEGLILIVAPIAYFVQNIFVFDNINTYIIFFTLLAYVNSVQQNEIAQSGNLAIQSGNSAFIGIPAIFLAMMLAVIYFVNIKPLQQARAIIGSLIATTDQTDPFNKTFQAFDKAWSYNTFGNGETLEQLARVSKALLDQEVPKDIKLKFLQSAALKIEDFLTDHPSDIRVYLYLADLYQSAIALDRQYLVLARDYFKKAIELSPKKQQIYSALANNYLINRETEKAMEILDEAIAIGPFNPEVHANRAIIAILTGQNSIVQAELKELNKIRIDSEAIKDPNALSVYLGQLQKIADIFIRAKDNAKAIVIYEELVRRAPNNEQFKGILQGLKDL